MMLLGLITASPQSRKEFTKKAILFPSTPAALPGQALKSIKSILIPKPPSRNRPVSLLK